MRPNWAFANGTIVYPISARFPFGRGPFKLSRLPRFNFLCKQINKFVSEVDFPDAVMIGPDKLVPRSR